MKIYLKSTDTVEATIVNFSINKDGTELLNPDIDTDSDLRIWDEKQEDYHSVSWDSSCKPARLYYEL